jgi:hypothetical protein
MSNNGEAEVQIPRSARDDERKSARDDERKSARDDERESAPDDEAEQQILRYAQDDNGYRSPKLRTGVDGRLFAILDDEAVGVRLRQCFPWSEPHRHLSLRDDDECEVVFIEDPSRLEDESRRAIEHALAVAGFVLQVTRVIDIDEEVEIRHWTVETAHGRRSFQTPLDYWPRVLPGGALLIRDVAGDLYRLPEPSDLDYRSRELLWAFVD